MGWDAGRMWETRNEYRILEIREGGWRIILGWTLTKIW